MSGWWGCCRGCGVSRLLSPVCVGLGCVGANVRTAGACAVTGLLLPVCAASDGGDYLLLTFFVRTQSTLQHA